MSLAITILNSLTEGFKASALNMEFYNGSLPPAIILRLQ